MAGGGITGDPHVFRLDGVAFDFHGAEGKTYVALQGHGLLVTMRVACPPADPSVSFVDKLEVLADKHRSTLTLEDARLDGKDFPYKNHTHKADSLHCKHWTAPGKERRLDVDFGGWRIALLHDDGTNYEFHGHGPLWMVPHLALFIDAQPDDLSGYTGLLIDGHDGVDPNEYEVKA